jgi:hypothetical protein
MILQVRLKSCANPDHGERVAPAPARWAHVHGLDAAIAVCRDYIARYNLGAGNWAGGEVRMDGKAIGRVSYNGRFWAKE